MWSSKPTRSIASPDSRVTAKRERNVVAVAAALGALLLARGACAQGDSIPEHPMMTDQFFIGLGALWADSHVQASLNRGTLGLGSLIDFEDDLGLKETNVIGTVMFGMRAFERWRLEIEYGKLDRDNERQASRTIDWGNLSIPIDTSTRATFDFQDTRVSVGYSFFKTKDKEIGIGLGVHWAKINASLSARNFGSEGAKESAPLPVITMYAQMALSDQWLLSFRVDRLSLDTGNIDGNVFSSGLEFVYQPWRHFNVGFGFQSINFQLSSTSADWRGKAQIQQNGPLVFIGTTF